MEQNYLMGEKGIQIDALLAAPAWNLKKMIDYLVSKREKSQHVVIVFFYFE